MADICHLSATEDGTVNSGVASDVDNGIGHTTQVVFDVLIRFTTAAAIDVTGFIFTH